MTNTMLSKRQEASQSFSKQNSRTVLYSRQLIIYISFGFLSSSMNEQILLHFPLLQLTDTITIVSESVDENVSISTNDNKNNDKFSDLCFCFNDQVSISRNKKLLFAR